MAEERSTATPRVLGLTGPIACGKSTVGDILLELGARNRIDADDVVHELMSPGTGVTARVCETFGTEVCGPDGAINRRRLGELVFADPVSLRRLEEIVHPEVRSIVRRRLDDLAGSPGVVIVDAVKLLQSDLVELCDAVWVVRCAPEVELERLLRDRGMTPEEARSRLAAQPIFEHPRVTTFIDNFKSRDALRDQVERAWSELL